MPKVQDVPHPEYFPDSFPPEDFPRYPWTERPASLPERAWVTETTHRDGQQGGLPLTAEQGLTVYERMCAFTGDSGALRQAEFFVYRPSDRAMLEGALERWRSGAPVEPTTWIRASTRDVALVRDLGVRETGMLASASDYHTFHKFKPGGRAQAARTYLEAVAATLDAGLRPRLHLEDATRAPRDFLLPFVEAVMELARPYGEAQRPRFRVCDTLGLGLPYDFVSGPRSVPALIGELRGLGLAAEDLEFHPHNDTHLVVANSLAAILAGAGAINGTLLGKGERSGNAPLEGVLLHLIGMGLLGEARPDFRELNALVELYASWGEAVPAKYPLYGRDAHRTRAGIHADGLNKFWWMYAPFDVPALLGRPLEVSLTKDSGVAGLIFLIRQHTGLELAKDDPRVLELQAWLNAEFDGGRQTAVEWEELAPRIGALVPA
ncbi:2-phosphinomethylmalic acid synthase [Deinobacterium chartae]|uniref:2-phosphinomethylmalic acid synthase n=1 Tax=Deinobacterium chartae TaxID=521158 RepID=A0A841I2G2_9DEIO|nr:pyruvate carboxyltransferase [Deinobacterium chartae]MBB6099867.1 2-phosphinomethylmalic acid synthase [Deinobacterium chartae]